MVVEATVAKLARARAGYQMAIQKVVSVYDLDARNRFRLIKSLFIVQIRVLTTTPKYGLSWRKTAWLQSGGFLLV
jgi:hypothetical protein